MNCRRMQYHAAESRREQTEALRTPGVFCGLTEEILAELSEGVRVAGWHSRDPNTPSVPPGQNGSLLCRNVQHTAVCTLRLKNCARLWAHEGVSP